MGAIIEARDLVKRFDDFTAVDHISFVVPEGVIFGFLGPNGAGKTTTIKMLTTVLRPSEGRLRVAGHDPVKEPLLVRRAFGIMFQDPSLDGELTAAENMELHGVLYRVPRTERRERIEALLRFVGLWERRDDYVKRFSGGMKRRLEVARAQRRFCVRHRDRFRGPWRPRRDPTPDSVLTCSPRSRCSRRLAREVRVITKRIHQQK